MRDFCGAFLSCTNSNRRSPAVSDRIAYSIAETAHRLGVSRSFLYLELDRGKLASCKIGGRRLVRVADADAYLAAHAEQAKAA